MSWIDFGFIVFLIFGITRGYRQGFLMELFSLLGVVLGILAGFKLMGIAIIYLSDSLDIDDKYLPYVAFVLVFIAVLILVSLVGRLLRASIDKSFLGRMDEIAGAALGAVKTVFILSVMMWILSSFNPAMHEHWTADSELVPYVEPFAPTVTGWVGEIFPSVKDIFE